MPAAAGVFKGMPEVEYHARPELSSTEARLILQSPAKYRWRKDHPPLIAPSKKFDVGSAVHAKVLGVGCEVVVIPQEVLASNGAISTSAAKAFVADAREQGLIPLKREEFEPIDAQAEAVLAHPGARALFGQAGDAEVTVIGTDPVSGVAVRARFDFLPTGVKAGGPSRVAVNMKTTRDGSPKAFTRAIADYGYDVQRSWYLDALRYVTGEDAELVFVAVEKEPPYLVAVHQLPTMWAEMGATKAKVARRTYAECVKWGDWPGYGTGVHLLTPPTWLVFEHEEKYPEGITA